DPEVLNTRLSALEKALAQTVDPAEKEAIQQKIDGINAQLNGTANRAPVPLSCDGPLATLIGLSGASMAAQVDPGSEIPDPCVTSPSAKYRGTENHLYRVEVHLGGDASTATFKWSRDNGSIATLWIGTNGNDLQVGKTRGFDAGVWVELSDDVLD